MPGGGWVGGLPLLCLAPAIAFFLPPVFGVNPWKPKYSQPKPVRQVYTKPVQSYLPRFSILLILAKLCQVQNI